MTYTHRGKGQNSHEILNPPIPGDELCARKDGEEHDAADAVEHGVFEGFEDFGDFGEEVGAVVGFFGCGTPLPVYPSQRIIRYNLVYTYAEGGVGKERAKLTYRHQKSAPAAPD